MKGNLVVRDKAMEAIGLSKHGNGEKYCTYFFLDFLGLYIISKHLLTTTS